MPKITPDQLADFVTATLDDYDRKDYVNVSFNLQNYPFANRMLDTQAMGKKGGAYLNWKVKVKSNGNARVTGMYSEDKLNAGDVLQTAKVGWVKFTTGWTYDVDEEEFQSDDRLQIIDEVLLRDADADQDLAELLEPQGWTAPSGPTDKHLAGFPYWLVKPTAGQEGFLGAAPSGFSDVAGLSPTTYGNWKSYVADYDAFSQEDLITRWIRADEKTNFMSPVKTPELKFGSDKFGYYTTYAVWEATRPLLRAQNDDLGNELAAMTDPVFRQRKVEWVAHLTNTDTSNPIYGVNWSKFQLFYKQGRFRVRSGPIRNKDMHDVWEVYRDSWINMRCVNRRAAGYCLAQV